tara:strand:+ start:152 stop:904 length:753 start_codon:yes stop_codon:yes gene_type:complete
MKNLKTKLTIIGITLLSINAFAQDYVYNGIKNVDATIGINNSKGDDSEQETVSEDCYDPANIGRDDLKATGCTDLLIVDNTILRNLVLGNNYTTLEGKIVSSYSDNNIFTGQVTNMSGLFCNYNGGNTAIYNSCTRKELLYSISNWNTENVTDMSYMFMHSSYNQPLNNWDVGNVTNMRNMFYDSSYNQSLNNWNVSNVNNIENMFNKAENFNQDISNWCVPLISTKPTFFDYSSGFENQTHLQPNWGCN